MALFKPFRGSRAALDVKEKHDGYAYFCIDDGTFHIDYIDENGELQRKQLNAKDAETILGATLVNELTNSDMEIPTGAAVMQALDERIVQPDWNQNDETAPDFIKNRTHYSVTRDETITLSFDGNSEGMDILESEDSTIRFVRVSDDTVSINDMRNASVNVLTKDGNDSVYDNLNPYIHIIDDKTGSYMVSPFMIVTFGDIVNEGFGKIKKGTWFVLGDNNSHVKSLTYTTEVTEIHKLDPKYLPDGGFGYENTTNETITLSIDGNIDGLEVVESKTNTSVQYVKVSDSPIEVNDMRNASLVLLETSGNEVLYDDLDSRIVVDDSTGSYIVNPFVLVFLNDTTTDDGNFTKGVWFTCGKDPANIKMSLTYTTQVNEIKRIDPKFLPTGGFGYEDKYEGQLTYTFDGDINNALESMMVESDAEIGFYYVKLSNNTPSIESIIGGTISCYVEGEINITKITEDIIYDMSSDGIPGYAISDGVLVLNDDFIFEGIALSAGVWSICMFHNTVGALTYISELSYYGTNNKVHKIDGKFLYHPDWSQNDPKAPDYVKNRICYTEGKNGTVTITYDGDINGKEHFFISDAVTFVKLSDEVPNINDCIGGTISTVLNEKTYVSTISDESIYIVRDVGMPVYRILDNTYVVTGNFILNDEYIMTPGVWINHQRLNGNNQYISVISYESHETVHKLDEKYLPEITWDKITDAPFGPSKIEIFSKECTDFIYTGKFYVHVIQPSPVNLIEGKIYDVVFDGITYKNLVARTDVADNMSGEVVIGNLYIADNTLEDTKEPFVITSNPATMNIATNSGNQTHTVQIFEHGITKIGKEYLQDEYATVEYVNSQRLAYETGGEVLATLELNTQKDSSNCYIGYSDFELIADKTYVITLDSGSYEMTAQALEDGAVVIGDLFTASHGYKSDIGFGVLTQPQNGQIVIGAGDCNNGSKMIISEPVVIKKIDPKFLPYDIATDDEIIAMFMEEDMFPVVADADGSVLADESDNILLW